MVRGALDEFDEFDELARPLLGLLRGVAMRLTRDPTDADDVLQEALYRALRAFDSFQRGTNFKAWMVRIVTNAFLSRYDRERLRVGPSLDDGDGEDPTAPSGGLVAETDDLRTLYAESVDDDVKRALDALPAAFLLPLLLSSLGDLSHQEIADTLGVPVGTVMSRLFRARARLRDELKQYSRDRGLGRTRRAP